MNRTILAGCVAALLATAAMAGDDEPAKSKVPKTAGQTGEKSGSDKAEVMEHLPIKQAKGNFEFRVDEGHWVYLTARISQSGDAARIDGEVTGINRTAVCGFHAAAIATLYDARDNVIVKIVIPEQVGVNGTFWGGSSGTKTFAVDLPSDIARKVRRFEMQGYQANHPNFIEKVKEIGEEAKKIYGGGEKK